MSEFYLVRHGQASFGSDNYDKLSALGHQQAIWLGQYFKEREISFDRVLVGDMVRHHETAVGICRGLDRDVADFEMLPQLNEFDFSALVQAYLTRHPELRPANKTDAKAYFKLLKKSVDAWQQDQLPEPIPERWDDFKQRVKHAMDFIHQSCTCAIQQGTKQKQRLLVVSSGGAKAMAIKHILGLEDDRVMSLNLQIKNTSISHFHCSVEQILLTSFNHVPHLDCAQRRTSITYS